MKSSLTITTKGLLLVSIPLLFQLIFIALLAQMQWTHLAAERGANHSREVCAQAIAVLQKMVDAETGLRGFNLYNNVVFLEPYQKAIQELPEELRRLKQLVRDDPTQAARAAEVEAKAQAVLIWETDTEQLIVKNQKARKRALPEERGREEKRRMDAFRQEVAEFVAAEEAIETQRDNSLTQSRVWFYRMLESGGVAALLLTVALALLFRRQISQRFALLTANTQRLAEGKELTPHLGGTDEIAQLDTVFHQMEASLREARQRERDYTATLERRVAERTAELTAVNRDLAEKNRENETFVYSVSHDLRSPLVNLQGFSNELDFAAQDLRSLFMEDGLPVSVRERGLAIVDGNIAESLRFILSGVTRLSNIINALLRLSRAGRIEYQWQQVDVNTLVRRVVASMHATAEQRRASIQINELASVWGDPTAVEQVFANLIGNALNYLEPQRPGRVEIGCVAADSPAARDGFQTYFVRDNGLGISEAYVHKVFQAFQRLHPNVAEGEGMGLAIVRRIVERHWGTIWVESTAGMGSTFYVALPSRPISASHYEIMLKPAFCESIRRDDPNRASRTCVE